MMTVTPVLLKLGREPMSEFVFRIWCGHFRQRANSGIGAGGSRAEATCRCSALIRDNLLPVRINSVAGFEIAGED